MHTGVASSPGRPVIELSTRMTAPEEDSVTDEINLSWATPLDDGGYPITGKWKFIHSFRDRPQITRNMGEEGKVNFFPKMEVSSFVDGALSS